MDPERINKLKKDIIAIGRLLWDKDKIIREIDKLVANGMIDFVVSDDWWDAVGDFVLLLCREDPDPTYVKDGRVTKLEGNPEHPLSNGRLCPRGRW